MIRRLTRPKIYTTDLPKYCERSDIENLLYREFSSFARDGVTWIRHYNIEVCGLDCGFEDRADCGVDRQVVLQGRIGSPLRGS